MVTKTNPVSVNDLKNIALEVRKHFNIALDEAFPIFDIIENIVAKQLVDLAILEDDDISFSDSVVAYYSVDDNTIYIKESLYVAGIKDVRSNFTLAHEFFHFLQAKYLKFEFNQVDDCKAFENIEWQANEFAGQLLIPDDFLYLNEEELANKYNVSIECALLRKVNNKKRKKKDVAPSH